MGLPQRRLVAAPLTWDGTYREALSGDTKGWAETYGRRHSPDPDHREPERLEPASGSKWAASAAVGAVDQPVILSNPRHHILH